LLQVGTFQHFADRVDCFQPLDDSSAGAIFAKMRIAVIRDASQSPRDKRHVKTDRIFPIDKS
jgi:hypothetical protein